MRDTTEKDITMTHEHQQEFIQRLTTGIRLEQESYLLRHPEIKPMLKEYIAKITDLHRTPMNVLKDAALALTRPAPAVQKEIKELLKIPTDTTRISFKEVIKLFEHEGVLKFLNENIDEDKKEITPTDSSTSSTNTSLFMSGITSASTFMTPELVTELEQTTSEKLREEILKIVHKAVFSQVTDEDIQYDIAYVELMYAVEVAMEIPVLELRKELADLLEMAYYMFELQIEEKKRIAAHDAAKNSIKKKLKKIMRYHHNFKGYETPLITGSEISLHGTLAMEFDKCLAQYCFNRYPKDRFGVYLPRDSAFSDESITSVILIEETVEKDNHNNADIEVTSQKSYETTKSGFVIATSSNLSQSTSISLTNKTMHFIIKDKNIQRKKINRVSKSTLIDLFNLQSDVYLFKPTRNLLYKHQN